jgi:hypothetical protein
MITTSVCTAGTSRQNVNRLPGRHGASGADLPVAVAASGVQSHHRPEGITQ